MIFIHPCNITGSRNLHYPFKSSRLLNFVIRWTRIQLLLFVFSTLFSCGDDEDSVQFSIWSGEKVTFTKPDNSDENQEEFQDRLTDNVWITRANSGQIFNIKAENQANKDASPVDTEWALGTTENIESLEFLPFRSAVGSPQDVVDKDLVLHLISDDVYIDVKFLSWTTGNGGGFSYERSTKN